MEVTEIISEFTDAMIDTNKVSRKKGLERFRKETFRRKETISAVFRDSFKLLVNCLSDESERCREISAHIFSLFLDHLTSEDFEACLSYLIPTMKQRAVLEKSEEVRLELITVLKSVVEHKVIIDIYVDDVIFLLKVFLQDKNPAMQNQCCSVISHFSTNYPEKFKFQANSLVDPLLPLQKIRAAAIRCLGTIVLHGGDLVSVHPSVAAKVLDQSPVVRMAVSDVVFNLIADNQDHEYRISLLLPLALSYLEDDHEDVRRQAETAWESIGKRWGIEQENVEKLENVQRIQPQEKQNMRSFTVGCCEIVRRHQGLVFQNILKDLNDWIYEKRITACKMLYMVLCHVKSELQPNVQLVFDCLETASKLEEALCVDYSRKASVVLGHFAPFHIFSDIIIQSLTSECTESKLVVLGGFLQGARIDTSKNVTENKLKVFAEALTKDGIRYSRTESCQKEFLNCLHYLIDGADMDICHLLVLSLITIIGLAASQEIADLARSEILNLCQRLDIDRKELFSRRITELFLVFKNESLSWTSNSLSIHVFRATIEESGDAISSHTGVVLEIIRRSLRCNTAEKRIKMLPILELFLSRSDDALHAFILPISAEFVQPALVWRTGLTERQTRTSATSCLYFLAKIAAQAPSLGCQLGKQVWHHVLALMEDEDEQIRLWVCRIAAVLIKYVEHELIVKSIDHLISRLEDSQKYVRIEAFKVLSLTCELDIEEKLLSRIRKSMLEQEQSLETVFNTV